MHAVGPGGQGDVDPVIYDQIYAVPGADRPQRRGELIKLATVEILFAKLERNAHTGWIACERAQHFVADLDEIARCDQAAIANQVELKFGRRTERAVQWWP